MSSSPFSAAPVPEDVERRRSRLVVLIATLGIAATLLAYAASPGVRHAVGHAAHSVRHAVGNVVDHDSTRRAKPLAKQAPAAQPSRTPSGATTP
ncbi:MAG TPA: hypothetical protein VH137_07730 [Gemmatimonadales bacterium]|nr:hypothetical protein [Gemmatimonadales bacterium]